MPLIIDMPALPYRPCVGIALFNAEGKVFVGERIDSAGKWQMPQGGIDSGEDIKTAAMRELLEEVGTDKAEIIRIAPRTLRYDLPPHLLGQTTPDHEGRVLWNGKFRGQEQTWVAMRFTGQDRDINLNYFSEPEFTRFQWADLSRVAEMIVPFKRDVYIQVAAMFKDIPPPV